MKILILHPEKTNQHKIATDFQNRGMVLLFPATGEEALQLLHFHGESIDLAVIHNDFAPDLIAKIKADPRQADLPIILTTRIWSDAECAAHQETSNGANAYIQGVFTEKDLLSKVEAVLGRSFPWLTQKQRTPPPPSKNVELGLEVEVELETAPVERVLEDMTMMHLSKETTRSSSFVLQPHKGISRSAIDLSGFSPISQATLTPVPPIAPVPTSVSISIPISAPSHPAPIPIALPDIPLSSLAPALSPAPAPAQVERHGHYLEPIGNAVVPGGAAHAPDMETFKKYLLLREQDVAVLSVQLREAREQIAACEQRLRVEKAKSAELMHTCQEQKKILTEAEQAKLGREQIYEKDLQEYRSQLKAKSDQVRVIEAEARELSKEMEQLKDRVRMDIRKIRVREKELENQLEMTRKDSEALIGTRESKVIELKRKLDLLEFNMDLLQDQYAKEKENSNKLRERLMKLTQVVRIADGILDPTPEESGSKEKLEKAS